jgi:hypothetical protein
MGTSLEDFEVMRPRKMDNYSGYGRHNIGITNPNISHGV